MYSDAYIMLCIETIQSGNDWLYDGNMSCTGHLSDIRDLVDFLGKIRDQPKA